VCVCVCLASDSGRMEKAVLAKLDAMFHDLRQENKLKHLREVHSTSLHIGQCHSNAKVHGDVHLKQHQERRFSLPTQAIATRRDSLPKLLLPTTRRDGRRSSLPILPARRDSKIPRDLALGARRDSLDSASSLPSAAVAAAAAAAAAAAVTGPYRKFSRDSIDGDGGHMENTDSIIFEEDEDVECVKEVHLSFSPA